jgi:uncharacterized SAM-binding protein YcdF (DUF218 family)
VSRRPHRHGGGVLRKAVVLLAVALIAGAVWLAGFVWFIGTIPRESPDPGTDDARTDAIVVLTGGSQRLTTGLALLERGAARTLFVSGVYDGVEVRELLSAWTKVPTELSGNIVLGYSADSTVGNAVETAAWMREKGYRSLRLVTANYHMRRSLLEFRLAMPGAVVIPHPVAPVNVRLDDWWRWRGSAALLASEYTKYLVVRLRWWIESQVAAPAQTEAPAEGPAR